MALSPIAASLLSCFGLLSSSSWGRSSWAHSGQQRLALPLGAPGSSFTASRSERPLIPPVVPAPASSCSLPQESPSPGTSSIT